MTSSQRVDAIYQGLFGRSSETAGLNYWVGQLDAGNLTIASVVNAVMAGALGNDATVVTNRVTSAQTYTEALNKQVLVDSYAGTNSATVAKTWLSAVTANTASVTTASSAIAASVKLLGVSGTSVVSASGTAITLTSSHIDILNYSTADAGKVDTLTGWSADKISVSKIGFASAATSVKAATDSAQQTSDAAAFYGTAGVRISQVGSDSYVYIDANKDGAFSASTDVTIHVIGAALVVGDITF